MINLI